MALFLFVSVFFSNLKFHFFNIFIKFHYELRTSVVNIREFQMSESSVLDRIGNDSSDASSETDHPKFTKKKSISLKVNIWRSYILTYSF